MSRVLIPSDNVDFVQWLAEAYARRGFEVVTGAQNFFHGWAKFDIVHHVWPEELTNWKVPDDKALLRVNEATQRWAKSATVIFSVGNLYPHGHEGNKSFWKLYNLIYESSSVIVHDSRTARDLVLKEWPGSQSKPHVVTNSIGYLELRPKERHNPVELRRQFGFEQGDLVILVFASLRFWEEVRLVMDAYQRVKSPNKRILVVARYNEQHDMSRVRRRYLRFRWQRWLKRKDCFAVTSYVPDEEIHRYFESADVVIIPRLRDLGSGVVGMAFTFGKLLIAPNHGSFPDLAEGTENLLYDSGDATSLAAAIDRSASMDRARIGEANRRLADNWTWDNYLEACLKGSAQIHPSCRPPARG